MTRTRRLAAEAGLDALLATSARNVGHLTGFAPANEKTTGVFWALMPTDRSLSPVLTVGDFDLVWARLRARIDDVRSTPLWIEIVEADDLRAGTVTARERPVQFDPAGVVHGLREALGERDLLSARIGVDMRSISWALYRTISEGLPDIEWVEADGVFTESSAIKTPAEVDALRRATELTEVGIRAILAESDPRGQTVSQLRAGFEQAVLQAVVDDPECAGYEKCRVYLSSGGDVGPNLTRHSHRVSEGDVVWIDAGCQVDGYASDIGRTFSVGPAGTEVRRIANALEAGSAAGFEKLRPGVGMREVFEATQSEIRAGGLPAYSRGHFGHAVGIGIGERGPYISADSRDVFVPGMVMAFERPFYARGLGGFQYEENFAITQTGADMFTSLPRTLIEI